MAVISHFPPSCCCFFCVFCFIFIDTNKDLFILCRNVSYVRKSQEWTPLGMFRVLGGGYSGMLEEEEFKAAAVSDLRELNMNTLHKV